MSRRKIVFSNPLHTLSFEDAYYVGIKYVAQIKKVSLSFN